MAVVHFFFTFHLIFHYIARNFIGYVMSIDDWIHSILLLIASSVMISEIILIVSEIHQTWVETENL